MKTRKIFTTMLILVLAIVIVTNIALAANPTPKPFPTVKPSATSAPHNGGGGGGGSSGYTAPAVVYPKYADIKNSDGQIIGNITQASSSDISFWAEQPVSSDGQTYYVRVEGKLNSLPSDARIDIAGESPDSSALPVGLSVNSVLAQCNLTGFSSGWDIKSGTIKLTLIVPQTVLGSADLSKSLIIRYDSGSYELLYPAQATDGSNVTFAFTSPHESFGHGSFSDIMLVTAATKPSPTPTPVPTEIPTPTAEESHGPSLITVLLAVMLAAVVAAAFVLYFMMQRKQ